MRVRDLAGRRVVIVDDDQGQADPLVQLLRLEGITARSEPPHTALTNLWVEPPDLLIADVKMPDVAGPDLIATLRVRHRSLPAILLTACAEEDPLVQSALATGRTAYAAKPVDLALLLEAIAALLGPEEPR